MLRKDFEVKLSSGISRFSVESLLSANEFLVFKRWGTFSVVKCSGSRKFWAQQMRGITIHANSVSSTKKVACV